ncbi:PAS domain S-box-containing protein/diguanylate cyclase (GGDEF) domain-containing protein [Cupriavidus sp. YR651]|uniref:putative bifunctional diguanylate cyclase/phosphodiesterase n=1 Tax=Cupriavidus sp. YR651 TaxID=1855315 RepID=UPI00087E9342|nr:EAL domain-containing protein [Cupriavidus sp. YR651]SDD86818.1 PAS domain S-box-containing protein/diguanylate cyclase (GGDEF) domain-containing protein [Cupriavidus sp. YR651]
MTAFSYDVPLAPDSADRGRTGARPATGEAGALLEASGALAMRVDIQGRILEATEATANLLVYPHEYLLRTSVLDIIALESRDRVARLLHATAQDGAPRRERVRIFGGIGASGWLDLRIVHHPAGTGEPSLLLFGYDITEWVESERELTERAFLDPLTGVGNRAFIRKRIEEYASGPDAGQPFAVALMDLDGFKNINDSLGHEFGDALLKEVGARLEDIVRGRQSVARLGGDEFVLMLDGLEAEADAIRILERVIHVCRQPFLLGGCQVRITTSIGLAFASGAMQSESQWLRRADLAMYEAKALGKNRYCVYSPELDRRLDEQFQIEQSMFEAVQNGEFLLHYQPIVWPGSAQVCAVEALMRWEHAGKEIRPDVFIPVAEKNGLIKHLGAWALRCACAQLAAWDAQGIHVGHMSVNVSAVQFLHPGFFESVRNAIHDARIGADRLVLEITESALMTDPKAAEDLLMSLRALGIRFAVDDFGTGYSSLSYLRRFPLSALKVDRSFVADMVDSPHARTIVSAVLSLARELGLVAIAEGVETDAQGDLLAAQGCDLVQGWRYARALSPVDFELAVTDGSLVMGQGEVFLQRVA